MSSRSLRVAAAAKLNLFLHVGDRGHDGYHALESLVVFAETADRITCSTASDLSLKATGPFARRLPAGETNLALKAAHALRNAALRETLGARIMLEKNLPIEAGLGGGSADAAAVLRGLNRLWGLDFAEAELLAIAADLGSDVPACLLSRPCWMEGRGERVTPLPAFPPLAMVLANPGVPVPTAGVFKALNARTGLGAVRPPQTAIENLWQAVSYLAPTENDLEAPACVLAPDIDSVLAALEHEPGCALAQMSGSGSTCFGLFQGEEYAAGAAERMAQDHPHWWVRASRIAGPDIGEPVAPEGQSWPADQ